MKSITTFLLVIFSFLTLSGCSSQGGLPAPCDQYATFCGEKTKISQW